MFSFKVTGVEGNQQYHQTAINRHKAVTKSSQPKSKLVPACSKEKGGKSNSKFGGKTLKQENCEKTVKLPENCGIMNNCRKEKDNNSEQGNYGQCSRKLQNKKENFSDKCDANNTSDFVDFESSSDRMNNLCLMVDSSEEKINILEAGLKVGTILLNSVADPDPVGSGPFGSPRSGSGKKN